MKIEYTDSHAGQAYDNKIVGKAFANNATTETEFSKIFERVQTAFKRVDEEIAILNNMADKLFGEQPPVETSLEKVFIRSGRVGDVLDGLDGLHDNLVRLSSAVSRLTILA